LANKRLHILTHNGSDFAESRKNVHFWVCTIYDLIHGVKFPKTQKGEWLGNFWEKWKCYMPKTE